MKSQNKKITINAISSIIQVTFTAFLYFFLYKYLINQFGIKQLGVWALILSFSSIANLANFGITSGLVKFVAEYLTEDDDTKLGKLIFTSIISMAVLFTLVGLLILFSSKYFLYLVIDKEFLSIAFSILPYSLGSLGVNAIGGVITSVLEGHQKNYLRHFIYVFSGIIFFIATIILAPIYKIQGVAMAQLIQAVFVLLASLIMILRINPKNGFGYWKWSNQSFKEIFNYGYKFQVVSISQLLYEPTTKLLLSKFGGLAMLGNYEMATRLVGQFRALLSNANEVVIPVIAETAKTKTKQDLQEFYAKMNSMLILFALPLSTLIFISAPFISLIWIGSVNEDFVFAMHILTISGIVNILCGPAYFSSMGEGRLSILVIVHVGIALLNLILGITLGWFFSGYGIVLAWAIALSIGSIGLIVVYTKKIGLDYRHIFTKNDKQIIMISLLILIISLFIFSSFFSDSNIYLKTIICSFSFLSYIPIINRNENFKGILALVKRKK